MPFVSKGARFLLVPPPPRYLINVECATFAEPAAPTAFSNDNVFTIETVELDGYNLSSTPPRLAVDVGWSWSKYEPWQMLLQQSGYRVNITIRDTKKQSGAVRISCTVESAILVPQTGLADGTTLPERRHIEFVSETRQSLWTPADLGESLLNVAWPVVAEVPIEPCRLTDDEYCLAHRQYHDHQWKAGDRVFVIDTARSTLTNRTHTVKYYATLARRAKHSWELTAVDIVEGPTDAKMKYVEESLLRKAKSVPQFSSMEEAEAWLEAHA